MSFSNVPWYVWAGLADLLFVAVIFIAAAWRAYGEDR